VKYFGIRNYALAVVFILLVAVTGFKKIKATGTSFQTESGRNTGMAGLYFN